MDIAAVISEVPDDLVKEINEKFGEAVRIHRGYKSGKNDFATYLKKIDELYGILFPIFIEVGYEPDSSDMGKLLQVWLLTRKSIEKTVKDEKNAELKTYIKNLSQILKNDIRFYKENYERRII